MTIKYCNRCNKQYIVDKNVDDYIHNCNSGNEVLDNEDITVIGDYVDGNISETNTRMNYPLSDRPIPNTLQGSRAANEGAKNFERTSRGNIKAISRTKAVRNYIPKEN